MKWQTIKEVADVLEISSRTVLRRLKKDAWETKRESNPNGGKDIVLIKLNSDVEQCDKTTSASSEKLKSQCDKNQKSPIDITSKLPENDEISEILTHPAVSKVESQCDKTGQAPLLSDSDNVTDDFTIRQSINKYQNNVTSSNPESQCDTFSSNVTKTTDPLKWIPLDRAEEISGISRSSLFRMIRNKELYSVVVADRLSKQKTLIDVSGFSREVQLKWKGEVLSSNTQLSTVLESERSEFDSHTQEEKDRAWHKKTLVEEYLKYRDLAKASGESLTQAGKQFEIKLNNREILPAILKQLNVISLSIKTIKKWEKAWRDSGNNTYPVSLIENRKGSAGRPKAITKKIEKKIKVLATNYRELSATGIYRMLEEELALSGEEMPIALRTLTLAVNKARKDKAAIALSKGKKAYKDQIRPHVFRINNAMPNDLWESDGHHMNNLVLSPYYAHQKPQMRFLVKPILIIWYDVATGLIMGNILTLTENQNAIRTSLKKAIQQYGLPKEIRVDNGSGYKNVNHSPHVFAGRKKMTAPVKRAKEMIMRGDNGLYANLGIKYSFTIPGNAESKMIEPFWGFCVSMFEKAFPVWIGNKIENRHEELRLTNKRLIKKYGDQIPTWEQYSELLDQYVNIWNNRKRSVLVNGRGEQMSPLEAFSEQTVVIPAKEKLDALMTYRYPQQLMVDRGRINVGGILYSHPSFMALQGRKVAVYYDESNFKEVVIGSEHGEVFSEPAKIIYPGVQVGDDMSAYIETKHREKIQKSIYFALESADSDNYNSLLLQSSEDMLTDQERIQTKQKHTERLSIGSTRRHNAVELEKVKELEYTDAEFEEITKNAEEATEEVEKEEDISDEFLRELQKNIITTDDNEKEEFKRALEKLGIQ